jgi:hypothetical protein
MTMAKQSYSQMLRHPRWQAKRLEVMQRAGFACESCGDTETTLNVHHVLYRKGAAPWEYEARDLVCLCERCHAEFHNVKVDLDLMIGYVLREGGARDVFRLGRAVYAFLLDLRAGEAEATTADFDPREEREYEEWLREQEHPRTEGAA